MALTCFHQCAACPVCRSRPLLEAPPCRFLGNFASLTVLIAESMVTEAQAVAATLKRQPGLRDAVIKEVDLESLHIWTAQHVAMTVEVDGREFQFSSIGEEDWQSLPEALPASQVGATAVGANAGMIRNGRAETGGDRN